MTATSTDNFCWGKQHVKERDVTCPRQKVLASLHQIARRESISYHSAIASMVTSKHPDLGEVVIRRSCIQYDEVINLVAKLTRKVEDRKSECSPAICLACSIIHAKGVCGGGGRLVFGADVGWRSPVPPCGWVWRERTLFECKLSVVTLKWMVTGQEGRMANLHTAFAGREHAKAWAVSTPNMASILFCQQQPTIIATRVLIVATVRQSSTILDWVISHYDAVAIEPRPLTAARW